MTKQPQSEQPLPESSAPSALSEFQRALQSLAPPVLAATVRLGRDHRASGTVIAANRVLTNAHAVRNKTIQVSFADGRVAQGSVAGVDADGDLAVITVDTAEIAPLPWAPTDDSLTTGSLVVAGHGRGAISLGMVTTTNASFAGPQGRRVLGGFEHSAPLAPGASGGPVVDIAGRFVGIDTARSHGGYRALSADEALQRRVEELGSGVEPARRRLGVALASPAVAAEVRKAAGLPPQAGLLIRAVSDGGPAARAELSAGDILVGQVGGPDFTEVDDLQRALDGLGDATEIQFRVVRGVAERTSVVSFVAPEAPTEE